VSDAEAKNTRIIIVRKEVDPVAVFCEDCKAYEKKRRHPSEGSGECRRFSPKGVIETLGAVGNTYRAKWPVVFQSEWCFDGIPKIKPIAREGAA